MSGRSMDLSVWVRMRDRFSPGLRGLTRGLDKFGRVARRIGAVSAIIGGLSFMGPANEAAAFDQTIRDIGVTAGRSHAQVEALIKSSSILYEDLALKTAQLSVDIAATAGALKAAGMDDALIDQLLQPIGKTATASSAAISDIGDVAFALNDNLKIPAERMEDSLGKLVVAGKEGRFELNEMAKYLPSLTSQMANLGVTGEAAVETLAAGLQIAMKGASDPAQAANNFKNFLSKISSPETIKRFAEAGTDITAVMSNAIAQGINPIEAVIAKTQDLTGVSAKEIAGYMAAAKKSGLEGAEALDFVRERLEKVGGAEKLGQLFGDRQVIDFLLPMLANIEEYKRIRDEVRAGDASIIDQDFETQLAGDTAQTKIFREHGTQAARDVGDAFNSWLPTINGHLLTLRERMQGLEADFPGVKEQILGFGAGAVIAAAGLGLLGLALPLVIAGGSALASVFALALSPIGLVIALLAGGAYLIVKHWDTVGPYFEAVWGTIKSTALDAWSAITGIALSSYETIKSFWTGDGDLFGFTIDEAKAAGVSALATAFKLLEETWAALKALGAGFMEGLLSSIEAPLKTLSGLGDPLGRVGTSLMSIARSLGDLFKATAEGQDGDARDLGKLLGTLFGDGLDVVAKTLSAGAEGIAFFLKGVEELLNFVTGKEVDWDGLFGAGESYAKALGESVNAVLELIGNLLGLDLTIDWNVLGETLAGAVKWIEDKLTWLAGLVEGTMQRIRNALGALPDVSLGGAGLPKDEKPKGPFFGFPGGGSKPAEPGAPGNDPFSGMPGGGAPPANDNPRSSAVAGSSKYAAIVPKQDVQVGGEVRIKVEGPGKVTGVSSDNPKIPVKPSSGRMVGRV